MSTFNLFNSAQKINEAISGANLLLNDVWGYTGNVNLQGSLYAQEAHVTNAYVQSSLSITGSQVVYGDISGFQNAYFNNLEVTGNANFNRITGNLSVVGNLNMTGTGYYTGDWNIGGSLVVNGVSITGSSVTNITENITGGESANSSTGDFTCSGVLRAKSGISIIRNASNLAIISGNNATQPVVSISGSNVNNVTLKVTNGSIELNNGYFLGAYRSADGSQGIGGVLTLNDLTSLSFKDGILVDYEVII